LQAEPLAAEEIEELDEQELIAQVARGNREATAELYDLHVGRVESTIARILGRREADHDDLVQAAFVQIVTSFDRFDGACSLATWVTKISAHVAYNALRSRRRTRAVFSASEAPADAGGVTSGTDPALLMRLRSALASLSPEKAETILLHDMLGHDLSEVAKLTGVTVAAAQSRLVRARRELRELLDGDEKTEGTEGGAR
jgi:RNA polymerase sigma-70 factor (ECF subfamily)